MRIIGLLLALALLGACGGGKDPDAGGPPASRSSATGSAIPQDPRSGGSEPRDPIDSATCQAVRNGIDAFNRSDFEGTVAYFVKAVPLAEGRAEQIDDVGAERLLEAVRYYADLAPEDYLEASASSPDFQQYKAITLGQCEPAPDGDQPTDTGPTVTA